MIQIRHIKQSTIKAKAANVEKNTDTIIKLNEIKADGEILENSTYTISIICPESEEKIEEIPVEEKKVTEEKSENTSVKEADNSKYNGNLAKTGEETFISIAISLIVITTVIFGIKNKKITSKLKGGF